MDRINDQQDGRVSVDGKATDENKAQPQYLQIVETLRKNLTTGHYTGGTRLPSKGFSGQSLFFIDGVPSNVPEITSTP